MQTVAQAARAASKNRTIEPKTFSCFKQDVLPSRGKPRKGTWRHNLTTDTAAGYTNRRDWQAKAMGAGPSLAFATAQGFATATTATTLTTGTGFPTAGQGLAGQIVVVGPNNAGAGSIVYGVIVSNTATVLTVDQWYSPVSTTGAAGTAPNATASYCVVPGQAPAPWLALTANAVAPTSADTVLTAEIVSADFARAVGTYSHTAAATTYALTHLFTSASSVTINKEAVFGAANTTGGGVMPFESAEPSPPTLISGDTLTQTITISIN